MCRYQVKIANKDFKFINNDFVSKGSREKRLVKDFLQNEAYFKYERKDYLVSEACSEKLSYEIACLLGYKCAKIELAYDENGTLGVLNYLFTNNKIHHMDAAFYLNKHEEERKKYYTISNIKNTLDKLNINLFDNFIKIMVFDALIGEQDRHEENWGIEEFNNTYVLAPLYDNGCNLLREFKDEKFAEKFYSKQKDFIAYIKRSKTIIYKEDNKNQYKHFELMEYLNKKYHSQVQKELKNLEKLNDNLIENIVMKIPDNLLTYCHKQYIIEYLKIRRDILLEMKEGEN